MKITLMIEGSASALAAILASLPTDGSVTAAPLAGPVTLPPPVLVPDEEDDGTGPLNVAAPQFDATGLPWDARIHSETKNLNDNRTWKKRRGGPKGAELAAIEASLRAAASPAPVIAPPAPVIAPPVPQITPPVPTTIAPPPPVVVAPPAPVIAPPPVITAPPPPPAIVDQAAVNAATGDAAPMDFNTFMQHIAQQCAKLDGAGAPLIHTEYLANVAARISAAFEPHGHPKISAITDIAANPQMIAHAVAIITGDGRW